LFWPADWVYVAEVSKKVLADCSLRVEEIAEDAAEIRGDVVDLGRAFREGAQEVVAAVKKARSPRKKASVRK